MAVQLVELYINLHHNVKEFFGLDTKIRHTI